MTRTELGQKLRDKREGLNLSRTYVNKYLNANDRSLIVNMELGSVSVNNLTKLCKLYGTTISELYNNEFKHVNMTLDKRLKSAIKRKGITQASFAKELGYPLGSLQAWLGKISGISQPKLETYIEICKKLDKM